MSFSTIAVEQREKEEQALKTFLVYSLIGSLGLHAAGLTLGVGNLLSRTPELTDEPIEMLVLEPESSDLPEPKEETEEKTKPELNQQPEGGSDATEDSSVLTRSGTDSEDEIAVSNDSTSSKPATTAEATSGSVPPSVIAPPPTTVVQTPIRKFFDNFNPQPAPSVPPVATLPQRTDRQPIAATPVITESRKPVEQPKLRENPTPKIDAPRVSTQTGKAPEAQPSSLPTAVAVNPGATTQGTEKLRELLRRSQENQGTAGNSAGESTNPGGDGDRTMKSAGSGTREGSGTGTGSVGEGTSGSGTGSGFGGGSGTGTGTGSGSGSGSGTGTGTGSGAGSGSGSGTGTGTGSGSGTGAGTGTGTGSGTGTSNAGSGTGLGRGNEPGSSSIATGPRTSIPEFQPGAGSGRGNSTGSGSGRAACRNCNTKYPERARQRGIEGRAEVAIDTDDNGKVTNVRLASSSGNSDLDEATLRQARDWELKPNTGGRQGVRIGVDFSIEGSRRNRQVRERQRQREVAQRNSEPSAASSESNRGNRRRRLYASTASVSDAPRARRRRRLESAVASGSQSATPRRQRRLEVASTSRQSTTRARRRRLESAVASGSQSATSRRRRRLEVASTSRQSTTRARRRLESTSRAARQRRLEVASRRQGNQVRARRRSAAASAPSTRRRRLENRLIQRLQSPTRARRRPTAPEAQPGDQ